MFKIYIGFDKEAIRDVSTYFYNVYEESWFEDDFVKRIIKTIDRSEVISSESIISPILGNISCNKISSSSKTLILLYEDEDFYDDLVTCGENCEDLLLEISHIRDREVSFSGYDLKFFQKPIDFICMNDGSKIQSFEVWGE